MKFHPVKRRSVISGGLVASLLTTMIVLGTPAVRQVHATDGCTSGNMETSLRTGRTFTSAEFEYPYWPLSTDTQIHQFTVVEVNSDGSNDASCTWTAPKGIKGTQLVVVGGGGAGGTIAGGGGAGGGVYGNKQDPLVGNVSYQITVGRGGVAKNENCDTDCNGENGRTSSVFAGSSLVASAGGGGGGGGNGASAIGQACRETACGGGGGGAAGKRGSGTWTGGAGGAWGDGWGMSYPVQGGWGGVGFEGHGAQHSGGGGGGGDTTATDTTTNTSFGGSGRYPLLTLSIDSQFFRNQNKTYGGGGGGMSSNTGANISYRSLEVDYSYRPASNSSGGNGGIPNLPATSGFNGFGGGGGGGAPESLDGYWTTQSMRGGNGGSGVVSIAYFQQPVVGGGTATLTSAFGTSATSPAFTATGGNNQKSEPTAPNSTVSYAWSIKDASGNAVSGISINSSGVVAVASSVPVGTYSMIVKATDGIGSFGTTPISVVVNKGAQAPLTFTSAAPINHHVGGNSYVVTVGGGSGTGAVSIAVDSSSSSVCQISGSASGSAVSFQSVGDCVLNANKAASSSFEAATQVQQTITITPRSSQDALAFTTAVQSAINVGDTLTIGYGGGSGTGAYSLTVASYATSKCSLSGNVVTALSLGFCVLLLNRSSDYEYEAATEVTQSFQIVAGRTVALSQPTQRIYTYNGSTVVVGVAASVSAGIPFTVAFRTTSDSTNCSFGHPSRYDLGFTGTGICKVYVEENDNTYSYTRSKDETFYVIAPGDTTAPAVTGVSAPGYSGAFTAGQSIYVNVRFGERMTVSGTPRLLLETGTTDRYATFVSGNYEDTLVFKYTMQTGDSSDDLDYKSSTSLELNGGTITDFSGNNAVLTLASPGISGSLSNVANIVLGTPSTTTTTTTTTTVASTTTTTVPSTTLSAPLVGALSSAQSGFTFSISGYDADLTYSLSATNGSVSWLNQAIGLVVVSGLTAGQTSQVTISVSCSNCIGSSDVVSGSALSSALTPTFGSSTPISGGFTASISNYSTDWTYRVLSGNAFLTNGLVTVIGLGISQSSTVTIESSRSGYRTTSAILSGMSNSTPTTTTTTTSTTSTSTTTTTVAPTSVSAPVSTVAAPKVLSVAVLKTVAATTITKFYGVAVPTGAAVSLVVSSSSKTVCKLVGKTLKGLKSGTCKVTITVTPKKGKKTSKGVSLIVKK